MNDEYYGLTTKEIKKRIEEKTIRELTLKDIFLYDAIISNWTGNGYLQDFLKEEKQDE